VYGKNYVSAGGEQMTKEMCETIELDSSMQVLDVGCGIGGSAFYMTKTYGCHVTGIDLSMNMIDIAQQNRKLHPNSNKVVFSVGDATKIIYPSGSFDVIHCRDATLNTKDKQLLFERFQKWLKPSGVLLLSEYCLEDNNNNSKSFTEFLESNKIFMKSSNEYKQAMSETGFQHIKTMNKTTDMISHLTKHVQQVKSTSATAVNEDDLKRIEQEMTDTLKRCKNGQQTWTVFVATK
jgi:phosphoethanolamine N-methyltransferase